MPFRAASSVVLAVAVAVATAAVAIAAAFTAAFDPVRAELLTRKAALSDATDTASKKQLAAVTKAVARLDKLDAAVPTSLLLDLKAAVATFAPLEAAFKTEFPKGLPATGDLAAALAAASDTLKAPVEEGFVQLTGAIGRLPAGKFKTTAQKQADIAGDALGAADVAPRSSAAAKALLKAQTAILKGLAIVAKAPARNVVTATIGTASYVGQNNYFDYFGGSGSFNLVSNATSPSIGGFISFTLSPAIGVTISGPGDYAVTGTIYIGADPVNNTNYTIPSGTLHVTEINPAADRASGTFSFTVPGHAEASATNGTFDFVRLRVQ